MAHLIQRDHRPAHQMLTQPGIFAYAWQAGHQHNLKGCRVIGRVVRVSRGSTKILEAAMIAGKRSGGRVAALLLAKVAEEVDAPQQPGLILAETPTHIHLYQQCQMIESNNLAGFDDGALRGSLL